MERILLNNLLEWKNNPKRKPLVLNGARQVGKTWLLKEFGKKHYENCIYISMDLATQEVKQFFSEYTNVMLCLFGFLCLNPELSQNIFQIA